ncbi:inorganic diphosphatase [Amnibacterium sp.]|uniref:inorganic diphosphatase n=1 Tax=Amnibacterium sp. TaxID=1872496 RepID=UPI003F7B8E0E
MNEAVLDVTIEIPAGGRNKYEIDHRTGRVRLDRTLFTAMTYPADYGYIEGTLGKDGDPLDALVLLDEPVFPGVGVDARPVGVLDMSDENGQDDKIIAVPAHDPRWASVRDVEDVPELTLARIRHFFTHYKELEPGKTVEVHGFRGRAAAAAIVAEAMHAHRATQQYES